MVQVAAERQGSHSVRDGPQFGGAAHHIFPGNVGLECSLQAFLDATCLLQQFGMGSLADS